MKKLYLLLLIPIAIACGEQSGNIEDRMSNVMAVHDSIMPWMDKMHELGERLEEKHSMLDSAMIKEKESCLMLSSKLDEAEEEMMAWMSEFKPEKFEEDKAKLISYLEEQQKEIERVGLSMKEAMDQAKENLGTDE
jgi:predicted RNase H-like nuclease (RuvC/YqgF family)